MPSASPKSKPARRSPWRWAWLSALLLSLLLHAGLMLWAYLQKTPDSPRSSTAVTRHSDEPIEISLFDPAQGRSDGAEDGSLDGDAPASDSGAPQSPNAQDGAKQRKSHPAPKTPVAEVPPSQATPDNSQDASELRYLPEEDIEFTPEPWGHALDLDELEAPDKQDRAEAKLEDEHFEDEPPSSPDDSAASSPTLPQNSGLPVPSTPQGGAQAPLSTGRSGPSNDSAGRSRASGSPTGQGRGDPGSAKLFDPKVIGRSVSRWQASQPSTDDLIDSYGTGEDDASKIAEQERVSARLGRDISDAQIQGDVRGGLLSSCNDGIDNNYDGWIDCGDPSCRAVLPFCRSTVVHTKIEHREIPDNHPGGISSEIRVGSSGTVRALSIKLNLKHNSPGDLAVVLEHVESQRTVVLKKTKRSERHYVSAFYTRDFNGGPVTGRWRLTVRDLVEGGTGFLEEWHLVITG